MPRKSTRQHPVRRVVAAVHNTPWAIREEVLSQIVELLELRRDGYEFTRDEIRARIGADSRDDEGIVRMVGDVAVLRLHGVMAPRMSLFMEISGGVSTQQYADAFKSALNNSDVSAIVLDVDSPGGAASGTEELSTLIYESRGRKPIVAVGTNDCNSAAYYVASAADELVLSPSTMAGSVGVFTIHTEFAEADKQAGVGNTVIRSVRHKADANEVEKLSADGRASIDRIVGDFYGQFVAAVARNRGVSTATVEERFGQGRTMIAERAVAAGMADRIGTLGQVLEELRARSPRASGKTSFRASNEEASVNPQLRALIEKLGLVDAGADDTLCRAAVRGWFAATRMKMPADEAAQAKAIQAFIDSRDDETTQTEPAAGTSERSTELSTAEDITLAERNRIADIRACGASMGASQETIEAAIEAGTSLESFAREAARQRERESVSIRPTRAEEDTFSRAVHDLLIQRMGGAVENPSPGYDAVRNMRQRDIAARCLHYRGERIDQLAIDEEIIAAALRGRETIFAAGGGGGSYNRPSDYPNLLSAAMGRMMMTALEEAPTTYRQWAWQMPAVPDFRPKTLIKMGEFRELDYWPDGDDDDALADKPSEEPAWISVDRFGKKASLTPVMLANDDIGGFSTWAQDMAVSADQTLNRLLVNLLTGNAAIYDGVALFHDGSHGNDIAAGGAPSVTELSNIREKLRKQTGVTGARILNLTLRVLLVPTDLETEAEQMLLPLPFVPVTDATTNPFRNRVTPIVEPMLDASSALIYYGFADPQRSRAIAYTHQRGYEGGFRLRSYFQDSSQSRVFQLESRFGGIAANHRGVVRNPGA